MEIAHNVMLSAKQSLLDISAIVKHSCQKNRAYYNQEYTVQEYLLGRVIFGEFVCKKQLADLILAI